MIVYSARARLVALARRTMHGDGDFNRAWRLVVEYPQYTTSDVRYTTCTIMLKRALYSIGKEREKSDISVTACEMVAIIHPRPCLQHLACCSVNSMQAQNRDFCLPHLHLTPLLGRSRQNIDVPFGAEKLEWLRDAL